MTQRPVRLLSVLPALQLIVVLLVGSLLVACDSGGSPGASDPSGAEWAGTWRVVSETTQTSVGEITTNYDEAGLIVYWTLRTDYVEEINAVRGVDGCGRVRSEVLGINGRVVTLDNGLFVYDVEYAISGNELTATVVSSASEPDLVGARSEAVAADGDARDLAGC